MAITIRKLAVSADKPINRRIMLYGDPGVGKTFFAGSAQDVPELKDVLVANIDKGAATLLSRGDIQVTDITGASNLEELLWMMVRKDPAVASIRTLVLDGGSELQKLDLAQIAETAAKDKDKRDRDANELNDYMKNKNRLLRLYRMARDVPDITLIITAWAKKKYPSDNKAAQPNEIRPDMTDGVYNTLAGYCDDVWYMAYDSVKDARYLYTGNMGPVFAKTRDQAVAAQLQTDGKPYLVSPTFRDIYAAYRRAYDVKNTKPAEESN